MSGKGAGGIALLAAAYLAVFLAAELWARLAGPKPEWPRKLVHAGCGIVSLFLPRLAGSAWNVFAMAVFFSGLCLAGRPAKLLRCLHGIDRISFGSELYPLSVFLVYVAAGRQGWLYASSILTLALADPAAALAGIRYGKTRYAVENECKSLEGSLAFMAVAFLAMLGPMLWMSALGWSRCLAAALLASFLATGLEAVSLCGADNFMVPVGTCLILGRLAAGPLLGASCRCAAFLAACVLVLWTARRLAASGAKAALAAGRAGLF